jgi:hypothetical protein
MVLSGIAIGVLLTLLSSVVVANIAGVRLTDQPAVPTAGGSSTEATPSPSPSTTAPTPPTSSSSGSSAAASPTTSRKPEPWLSGAWVGVDTLSQYLAFGTWRGRPLAYAEQHMVGFDGVLDIGVPLLPDNGWEPNAVGSPWTITGKSGMKTADYVAAFRHVATLMRSVLPGVQIVYCGDFGVAGNVAVTGDPFGSLYPGDAYVDVIGVDVYSSNNHPGSTTAEFTTLEKESHGLTAWADFAKAHDKPLAVPEWGFFGSDSRVHDSPSFIQSMHAWFVAQNSNLAYESYFSDSTVDDVLTDGSNPLSAAAYKALWAD